MTDPSIYSYILREESNFETDEIRIADNWTWNFRRHVQLIFQLKNSVFSTGSNTWLRAFKNIMEPILNLSYWAEDIEMKDVIFFIEEKDGRALSFLIKKYHDEVFVRKYNLDTMLDEITESDLDYGGVLVQRTNTPKPEVLPLQTVAFCDQTDILGGPIAFKHHFSPGKLREMEKFGWGKKENGANITIDELIALAETEKAPDGMMKTKNNKTPGKQIPVYILRGNLPEHYLKDNNVFEKHPNQIQIVAFYKGKDGFKEGVTLYRKEEDEGNMKFHTSKKVHGRALGRGAGEALLHPQIWTNFLTIHKMNMLEAGSKVPLYTDDPSYTQRNKIQEMENLEVTVIEDGKKIYQVPTAAPVNVQLLDKAISDFYEQGQLSGSAFDPLLGKEAASGTTFRGQERVVQQGKGLHERRRGQRAKFIEEIYRDWIIPDLKKEILGGVKFLTTLSTDELQHVVENAVTNESNDRIINYVLDTGQVPTQDEVNLFQQIVRDGLNKKGNKHMLEILKGEYDDVEVKIGINVASKQKDLAGLSDKIFSIFETAFANPTGFMQTMKIPGMAKAFEDILEYGGLNPVDFSALVNMPDQTTQQAPPAQESQQISPINEMVQQSAASTPA